MLCLGGLGLCFWMSVEVSCTARRQSSHFLTVKAPPCCCEVHPVAEGSCSSAAVSTMGYALRQSLSVVVDCLGNGRLRRQWACISVGAGCLGNGGCPSPMEHLRDRIHSERLESPFCPSHCATPNAVSLQSPGLAYCPSPVQSEVQPSEISGCQFNRAPGQRALWGALGRAGHCHPSCRLHQAEPLSGIPRLLYTWEFPRSVGNKDQSKNAAPTHLSAD